MLGILCISIVDTWGLAAHLIPCRPIHSRMFGNSALLYSKTKTTVSVYMHLAAFTANDKHAAWLRGHFITEQTRRKAKSKEKEQK